MSHVSIRDASTLLLLRHHPQGFSVLMVKRSPRSSFMPSLYVYPGGALDAQDSTLAQHHPLEWSQHALDDLGATSPQDATALCLAALRETFEEAGILLTREPAEHIDLKSWRARLNASEVDLSEVLASTGLSPDLEQLTTFARWITPTFEHRRFDARFFIARCPPTYKAEHDNSEVVEHQWLLPQQAIDLYHAGDILLSPPTLATLTSLATFDSVDAVFEDAQTRAKLLPTMLPHRVEGPHGPRLLLPDHPEFPHDDSTYAHARGGARWSEVSMSAHKRWVLTER